MWRTYLAHLIDIFTRPSWWLLVFGSLRWFPTFRSKPSSNPEFYLPSGHWGKQYLQHQSSCCSLVFQRDISWPRATERERVKERQCGVILMVLVAFICVFLDVYALWGCVPGDELEPCQAEDTTPYKDKSCWRFRLPAGWYSCRVRVPQLWELQPDGVQKPDVLELQIFAGIGCTGKYICFLQSLTSIKRHTQKLITRCHLK